MARSWEDIARERGANADNKKRTWQDVARDRGIDVEERYGKKVEVPEVEETYEMEQNISYTPIPAEKPESNYNFNQAPTLSKLGIKAAVPQESNYNFNQVPSLNDMGIEKPEPINNVREQVKQIAIKNISEKYNSIPNYNNLPEYKAEVESLAKVYPEIVSNPLENAMPLYNSESTKKTLPYLAEKAKSGLIGAVEGLESARNIGKQSSVKTVRDLIQDRNEQGKQEFAQAESENVSPFLRGLGGVTEAITRMVPSIALGAMGGSPVIGTTFLGTSAAGSARQEALNEGAPEEQASIYGLLIGSIEGATESLVGGIPFMKGIGDKAIGKLTGPIKNKIAKTIANKIISAGGEGVEEVISGFLEPYAKRATYDKTSQNKKASELASDFAMGVIVSGVLQLPEVSINLYNDSKQNFDINNQAAIANETAIVMGEEYKSNQMATEIPVEQMDNDQKMEFILQTKKDLQSYTETKLNEIASQDMESTGNQAQTPTIPTQVKSQLETYNEQIKQQQNVVDDLEYQKNYLGTDITEPLKTETDKLNQLVSDKQNFIQNKAKDKIDSEQAYQFEQGNANINELMNQAEGKPSTNSQEVDDADINNSEDNFTPIENDMQDEVIETPTPKKDITQMSERTVVAGVEGSVGDKKVKSYQFENPEVKPYFQTYANYILNNEFVQNENLDRITDVMKKLKADTGHTPSQIKDALQRLVSNDGQENQAAAKRVEIVIDDMLTNGFTAVDGTEWPADVDYVSAKSKIEGQEIKHTSKPTLDDIPAPNNFAKPTGKLKDTDQIGMSGTNVRTVKDNLGNTNKLLSPYGQAWKDSEGNWNVQMNGKSEPTVVESKKVAMAAIDSDMERTEVKAKKESGAEQQDMFETKEEVPTAFKGTQPGELDYKPITVGMQTRIVNKVPNGQTAPFQYEDQELEKVHKQNKGVRVDTFAQKVVQGFNELKEMFTRPIKTLPIEGNEQFYYGRNGLINLTKAKGKAGDETTRIIADITKDFKKDKNAFDIFSRKVFLDDLAQEVKLGNALPNMWTPESVASELQRLDDVMPQSVIDAIVKRKQHWDDVKKRYITAMNDVGVNMEGRLQREDYFRHQVLDYMDMKNVVSGVGNKLQTPANRGFTKGRSGEYTGNINTDYIQAEYEVIAQMLHDVEVDNTIKFIDRTKNIVGKVKTDAKAQGIDNWKEVIPEGYVTWQPTEGNMFYMYKPVAEEIVEGALSLRGMDLQSIKDPKIKVILEDIINDLANQKEVLALGGKRKEFVVKQEVADTLNNMIRNKPTSIPAKFFQSAHTLWKRWILYLNPRNFVKYNTRNAVGDLDAVVAGNPSGLSKTLKASVELADAMRNGKFTTELKSFYDLGGYQATQAAQEISQTNKLKPFETFRDNLTIGEKIAKPFNKYEEIMSDANAYREMVLRYGSYLDYLEQFKNGELKNYGASKKSIIDALKTNEEKAYKLSDDLLGAYDDVSEAGKFLRRQFIPFYSWLETNFKRYNQLFANAVKTGDTGTTVKTAAGLGIKTGLSVTRKMGGIFALTAILATWNKLKYPDLEETLPEDVKSRPHVILGKDKDGNTIYFSRLGSLNDFAEWFGLDNAWQDAKDILDGKKTIMEQLGDMVKSPINKVLTGIRPEIKTTVEYLSGKKFYPDVFNPSNIRDKNQYVAQGLGLGNEYNTIMGKPNKSYESTIADIFMYKSNPEESAYWSSLNTKSKYQKKLGKSSEGFYTSDKSNALYNYKLALKYEDKKTQDKYMKLYESYGGNSQQTIESVITMSPYYGIAKDEIKGYKTSLSEKQQNTLKLAEDYFINLLESELTSKNPSSDGTKAMIDIYKKTYETKQFPKIISNKITYSGVEHKLTQKEVTELQNRVNEKMYARADEVVKTETFKKQTPEVQSSILSNTLNNAVAAERSKWIREKYAK